MINRKKSPKVKMIEIWEDSHIAIKVQSAMRQMTMREYMDWLVKNDEKEIQKRINND